MGVVGFDFGTTNCLVSVVDGGRILSLLDDGAPIPSVVCYEGAKTIVGMVAKERLGQAGLGVQGNVIRSPKTLLGQETVHVSGVEKRPVDIVRDVVIFVREQSLVQAKRRGLQHATGDIDRAIVTIPVNMNGRRRAELRDAFRMAGISIVQFLHEPLAALYGHLRSSPGHEAMQRRFDRQLLLVCDWGGGTLDLTLCRLVDGSLLQILNDGSDDVGGDVFDDTLKNEIERRVRAKGGLGEDVRIQPDALTRLMHACERAKIEMSKPAMKARVQLFVSNFYRGAPDPDLAYSLSRDEMDEMVASLLDKGLARIERLLARGGYSPASVAMCLATGGMANLAAIQARLHETFGPGRVEVSERGASLISEGAAWVAYDEAKLLLAKTIELQLARNTHMPLVDAFTEMPREGEVKKATVGVYCSDPRDGFAKFQLQSPIRPGREVLTNDERVTLENLVVAVDAEARPFLERLELDVQINDNLILLAAARSPTETAEVEVHNLEFAIALPLPTPVPGGAEDIVSVSSAPATREKGSLVIRSNIANSPNNIFVPGELLEMIKPAYFNPSRRPPQIQVEETVYYKPCALCGRRFNDPACRCSTALS